MNLELRVRVHSGVAMVGHAVRQGHGDVVDGHGERRLVRGRGRLGAVDGHFDEDGAGRVVADVEEAVGVRLDGREARGHVRAVDEAVLGPRVVIVLVLEEGVERDVARGEQVVDGVAQALEVELVAVKAFDVGVAGGAATGVDGSGPGSGCPGPAPIRACIAATAVTQHSST